MKQIIFVIFFISVSSYATPAQDLARSEVKPHLKEVKICFTRLIGQMPGTKGNLVIDWSVSETGAAEKISLNEKQSTIQHEANDPIVNCITDLFKTWKFTPAPKGEDVSTSYLFVFSDVKPFLISN